MNYTSRICICCCHFNGVPYFLKMYSHSRSIAYVATTWRYTCYDSVMYCTSVRIHVYVCYTSHNNPRLASIGYATVQKYTNSISRTSIRHINRVGYCSVSFYDITSYTIREAFICQQYSIATNSCQLAFSRIRLVLHLQVTGN